MTFPLFDHPLGRRLSPAIASWKIQPQVEQADPFGLRLRWGALQSNALELGEESARFVSLNPCGERTDLWFDLQCEGGWHRFLGFMQSLAPLGHLDVSHPLGFYPTGDLATPGQAHPTIMEGRPPMQPIGPTTPKEGSHPGGLS